MHLKLFFLNLQTEDVTINLELGLEEVRPLWMKALVPFFEVEKKELFLAVNTEKID